MTFLVDAYTEDEAPNTKGGVDKRTVLRLDPRLAPVKVAVLPLSRNEALTPKARDLATELRGLWNVEFDDAGAIGRRYRRQDEIGTPYCVTVDFDTLEDDAVTVRERDSMQQERISARRGPGLAGRAPRRLLSRALVRLRAQMPALCAPDRHNDRVTRPPCALRALASSVAAWSPHAAAASRRRRRRGGPHGRALAVAVAAHRQRRRPRPASTLTKAGETLKFGEPAIVAYEPNPQRSSVLELSVDSVAAGQDRDLAAYQLTPETKKSRALLRQGAR